MDVAGRHGWTARKFKEVAADETTLRFWQEIYDDALGLVEIHKKFPVDKGHQKVYVFPMILSKQATAGKIAPLGVADVRAFGLTWKNCEELLNHLGFVPRVEVVAA